MGTVFVVVVAVAVGVGALFFVAEADTTLLRRLTLWELAALPPPPPITLAKASAGLLLRCGGAEAVAVCADFGCCC